MLQNHKNNNISLSMEAVSCFILIIDREIVKLYLKYVSGSSKINPDI